METFPAEPTYQSRISRMYDALRPVWFIGVILVVGWHPNWTSANEPTIDFSHEVVPILKTHCVECHGGDKAEGGFSLNTRDLMLEAGVVEPGDIESSLIIEKIESTDPEERMPPEDHARVPEESVVLLRRWVESGLPWQEGFTFATGERYEMPLEPRRPELPPSNEGRENPIDRILDAYLAEHQISRPEPIDDAQFLRRASLDILGLPPTPKELAAFLDDQSTDKRNQMVDVLLHNREAYATHWLTFWNDLLRNAYSGTGFIEGGRTQITAWLFRSLLENKPFDQFVRELISPSPESEGFIDGFTWRGNVNASQTPAVQFAQNLGQVFLGINLKCASCHDSFIDRWTLKETYALAAVYAEEPLELTRCDKPLGIMAQAGWLFPELGSIDPAAPQQDRLKQLAALMAHPQNGRVTRTVVNRIWHRLMGRGIVHPVDAMNNEPWSTDLLDFLAVYLTDHNYDLKAVIRLIATSSAYQSRCTNLAEEATPGNYVYSGPVSKRMTVEQFLDSIWQITSSGPKPKLDWFKSIDGSQGGQLSAVLSALEQTGEIQPVDAKTKGRLVASNNNDLSVTQQSRWGDRPVRAALTPLDLFQAGLGRPNREQVVTSRPTGLTTLEAIMLANGTEMSQLLHDAAHEIIEQDFQSPRDLIEWIYLAALSRRPTSTEQELLAAAIGPEITQEAVEDLLWNVFLLPEFQLIR